MLSYGYCDIIRILCCNTDAVISYGYCDIIRILCYHRDTVVLCGYCDILGIMCYYADTVILSYEHILSVMSVIKLDTHSLQQK